jgi:hypothetical protein
MATYYRRDEWVQDALGNAISGAQVYVCSQPATTGSIPPSPLAQLYADSAGVTPLTQPVLTDGYGHAFYYVLPGTYTVVYYSQQIEEVVLADQNINSGSVSIPLAVAQGGTGATTATQALINLGGAARGANADITSLAAIPNTEINGTGYVFENAFGTNANGVTIADQSWASEGYTGPGVGVATSAGSSVLGAGILNTVNINTQNLNATSVANIGILHVGTGSAPGVISTYGSGQPLSIGAAGNPTGATVIIASGQTTPTSGQGLLEFGPNYYTQTTVGAGGGASAMPTPKYYIQIIGPDGVLGLIPVCNHT